MSSSPVLKQERLHIRLNTQAKSRLEKAAAYLHESVSEFVLEKSLESAAKVIEEHEALTLPATDFSAFLAALENPPAQNAALGRAFEAHQAHVSK